MAFHPPSLTIRSPGDCTHTASAATASSCVQQRHIACAATVQPHPVAVQAFLQVLTCCRQGAGQCEVARYERLRQALLLGDVEVASLADAGKVIGQMGIKVVQFNGGRWNVSLCLA